MSKNYTVYHLHSDMSNGVTNIDSVTKYQEYVDMAKQLGMKAIGFSEHGSVFAWDLKKESIEKAGLKYIHGEEFYVTESIEDKKRDNYHCILIAKNWDGVKELNKLASLSFNRQDGHFYYVPRITVDELISTSKNIIITTACLAGVLSHSPTEFQKKVLNFMVKNKDRCFLEIQHHNVEDQITYNKKMLDLSNKYGLKLIAGTDTHSLNQTHAKGRVILQKAKNINFENEDGWDLTFKSYDELIDAYRIQNSIPRESYIDAIENTNVLADMVQTFDIDRNTKYPHIYNDPIKTLKQKINNGYKDNKYIKQRYTKEEITKRLTEELAVYEKVGAIDFMLLEAYIREWENQNGIQCGYGRGSVSGSLIAYLLGITQMDSLKFDLNFFRFMNPSRISNADIDTDYCGEDRDRIKYFLLHDKLNLPNIKTAEIITFNTIAMKGAIKDVCRALGISLDEAQAISDAVELDENKQWFIDPSYREKYSELFEYVDIVNGTIVSIGTHPSGVLVSDKNIEEIVGLCSIATSDYPVSMLDMHGLDGQMFVKLDILGLDNIGVINECCKLAGIDRMTPDNIDLNDEKVWKSIRDDTTMIFQWESNSAQDYLKRFMSDKTLAIAKNNNPNFSYIKWFSFGNGLIRPGCASFRDSVASGEVLKTGFKELDEFLAITFGRVVMQEDIMKFCKQFCGYSDAESDNVRRAIAKKKGTAGLLDELHDRFVEYSHNTYGVDVDKLEEIFPPIKQGILDASLYAFSWNHSDAYSCIGYISGYLRYYYPIEFLTAAFNIFTGKEEKITAITNYAKQIGVEIKDIKFGHSKAEYNMDKENNVIYKGMESIKYMNADVSNRLYEMSKEKEYKDFIEILCDFPGDSRQLDILIKLGYFDDFGNVGDLLAIVENFNFFNNRKQIAKEKCPIEKEVMLKYAHETEKQYKIFDSYGLLSELCHEVHPKEFTLADRIGCELEYLGYINYVNSSLNMHAYVMDIDVKYSPRIKIYCLDTGITKVVKMYKKSYLENPVDKGVIITYGLDQKAKSKLNPDTKKWEAIPGEYEDWFRWYSVRNTLI